MYNVFKRPMFRKGGSSKGTGIMSHVEPRVHANQGFFGNSKMYNFPSIPNDFSGASAAMGMGDGRVPMMKSFPMDAAAMGADVNFKPEGLSAPPKFDVNEEINTTDEYITINHPRFGIKRVKNPNYKVPGEYKEVTVRGQKSKRFVPYDKETIEAMKVSETGDNYKAERDMQNIISESEKNFAADKANKELIESKQKIEVGDNDGKLTLDIMEEVEGEKKILNKLLKNDKFTRGENALIIAQALNTPGGLNDKIAAATAAALPVAVRRNKEDKAVTLAAYKYAKDKEKTLEAARIKANTPTSTQKNTNTLIDNLYKSHQKEEGKNAMTKEDFTIEWYKENTKPGTTKDMNLRALDGANKAITNAIVEIQEAKVAFETEKAQKKPKENLLKTYEKNYKDALAAIEMWKANPEWENSPYNKMLISVIGQQVKDGGRIGYALGSEPTTMSENFTAIGTTPAGIEEVSATEVDTTGGVTTEKPVIKLDYATLRKRLPPEINDQVVALLASSEKALQDFAYITTQADVDRFNVTYGVNLVIPPQTQTA